VSKSATTKASQKSPAKAALTKLDSAVSRSEKIAGEIAEKEARLKDVERWSGNIRDGIDSANRLREKIDIQKKLAKLYPAKLDASEEVTEAGMEYTAISQGLKIPAKFRKRKRKPTAHDAPLVKPLTEAKRKLGAKRFQRDITMQANVAALMWDYVSPAGLSREGHHTAFMRELKKRNREKAAREGGKVRRSIGDDRRKRYLRAWNSKKFSKFSVEHRNPPVSKAIGITPQQGNNIRGALGLGKKRKPKLTPD